MWINTYIKYISMALKVSTREFQLNSKELENLNNSSLKIRTELKIANFLFTILKIFCDLIFAFLNF